MADLGAVMRSWRCRRLAAALVDYVAGELPPSKRRPIERHVAACADCAAAMRALSELPPVLRGTAPVRDDAFWRAQREAVMQAIHTGSARRAPAARVGFDWRLALPIAAALAIGLAGYVSLRAPTAPGEVALETLPAEDLSALVEVAEGIIPAPELLPDVGSPGDAVGGAVDAGWIRADDLPPPTGWGELDDGDLEALHGLLG